MSEEVSRHIKLEGAIMGDDKVLRTMVAGPIFGVYWDYIKGELVWLVVNTNTLKGDN